MAAVQAAAPRVSWAWTWGILFCWGWLLRSGACAAVACAEQFLQPRAAFLLSFAHGEGRKLADLRSAGPHLRARPRCSDLRAKSQHFDSYSRWSCALNGAAARDGGFAGRLDDANRGNLDQSGLFWLLSPRLATGCVIGLPLWGHIKSLLRTSPTSPTCPLCF